LLGRSELKFEAVDGRYVVTRDGQPAAGLSVGERTVIALVHFLESAARFDDSGGKPIVVIDDPVSSLDNDTFMGISTYIWAEAVAKDHIAQVVLLTHNFDLFRQWDVQIEGLHRGKGMAPLFPANFYEIRSQHTTDATGNTRRRPYISAWPTTVDARRKLRSSYHHAFMALARAKKALAADDSLDNRLDAQLLFPNVIRRLLETFLAFKRPEWVGDFSGAMRNSAALLKDSGYAEDTADALRLRLTRYAHAGSHADTPATDSTVNPDEVATAITDAFAFMKCVDEPHFRGLCEVLDLKPQELLKGSADPATADSGQSGGGTEYRP
jgi:wobble nucleotide-excising tRNase